MKKKYIFICVILLVVIIIGFSQRGNSKQVQTNKILIGAISPLSGPAGTIGEEVKHSLDLTQFENIEIVHEDDQCDAKKALSAYQNLKLKGIKLFYVACSGSVMSLAPLAKENGDLILTAYAGSSEIRKTGTEVIRFVPDATSVVDEMVKYLMGDQNKKYGILYENLDYPKSAIDSLSKVLGDKIVFSEGYNGEHSSFKTQLLKFMDKNIGGIIIVPVSDKAAQIIFKEMQQLHIADGNMSIIGDVNLCDYPFKPSDFGLHGVCWQAGISNPGFDAFASGYETKYGVKAQYPFYSALTHDSLYILSNILKDTKNADPKNIAAEILKGQKGLITDYQFDAGGEVVNVGKYLKKVEF